MGEKENEFVWAAKYGNFNKVKRFLETRQVDVNCRDGIDDNTALIEASKEGHIEIVKLLIKNEADIHLKGFDDYTALIKVGNQIQNQTE